jgi:integrase
MPKHKSRRPQSPKHSGFGSLCWVGAKKRWIVKGYAKAPDGSTKRPRLHTFPLEVQTRWDAEQAFGEWVETQRREQAMHLRLPALDVRSLCAAFIERGIDNYARGTKSKVWHADRKAAEQWSAAQGDIRLSEYDGDHLRAFRAALDKLATKGRRKGENHVVSTREGINRKITSIRRVVAWGVSCKLCQPGLVEVLRAVKGFAEGESAAKDGAGRTACTIDQYEATMEEMPPSGRAACILIRWSGARPTEVLSLHRDELERVGDIYRAVKAAHKTAGKGFERTLYFAPAATPVIEELLDMATTADPWLFSARRIAVEEPGLLRVREGSQRTHIDYRTLGEWINRTNAIFGIPHWTPYQLCHLRLSEIDAALGKEYAQAARDHSSAVMTANYTKESDRKRKAALALEAAMVGVNQSTRSNAS